MKLERLPMGKICLFAFADSDALSAHSTGVDGKIENDCPIIIFTNITV
jgi:hypothetical protein